MSKIIAACGNDCAACPRYVAHPYEKTEDELRHTAELWIKTCAECNEYPCDNMRECFQVTKSFEPKCREVCTDEEYVQLKKAFFEKEENLKK